MRTLYHLERADAYGGRAYVLLRALPGVLAGEEKRGVQSQMIHSYPWYFADWLGSETRVLLTPEGRGIYRDLLDKCWEQGSLPSDEKVLAKLADCQITALRRCWPVIQKHFVERDGRLYNQRVDADRPRLINWREARRSAGKRGGEARSKSQAIASSKTEAIATGLLQANVKPPSSSSSSSSSSVKPSPLYACDNGEDPAAQFLAAAQFACEHLPAGGDVRLTAAAMEREFAKSASFDGDPSGFCLSFTASVRRWRAAYDANPDLRTKAAQWWVRDGAYSQQPPKARAPRNFGPVDLKAGEDADGL